MTAEVVKDAIVVRDGTDWAAAIPTKHAGDWFIVDAYNAPSPVADTRQAIGMCTAMIDDEKFAAVWRGIYRLLRSGLRARFELEHPYAPTP